MNTFKAELPPSFLLASDGQYFLSKVGALTCSELSKSDTRRFVLSSFLSRNFLKFSQSQKSYFSIFYIPSELSSTFSNLSALILVRLFLSNWRNSFGIMVCMYVQYNKMAHSTYRKKVQRTTLRSLALYVDNRVKNRANSFLLCKCEDPPECKACSAGSLNFLVHHCILSAWHREDTQ